MSIEQFEQAVGRFCEAHGLGDPHHVLQGGRLSLDDRPMQIEFVEATDCCRITINLGPPPASAERACYQMLLECNHQADGMHRAVMSLQPQTGCIELSLHLAAIEISEGDVLDDVIHGYLGGLVDAWDETLDELLHVQPMAIDGAGRLQVLGQH